MGHFDRVQYWNVTDSERRASYPCEDYAPQSAVSFLRGIDVDSPAETVFRWLCQLKIAPYSYDWIDNAGRRSPRELTPGADDLALGQRFQIARIVAFETGRHITGVSTPLPSRVFGPIAATYQVSATGADTSRLVVCMAVGADRWPSRIRRRLLGYGDLMMMRKQLLTLKERAESSQHA